MKRFVQAFGAVDIGGTKISVGLVAPNGQLLDHDAFATEAAVGPQFALSRIEAALRRCLAQTDATLAALGIACTGPVDPQSGVIGKVALLPGWDGFPLGHALQESFAVPVCLENDCDAAALAESKFGSGQGLRRFLFVSLSTGIGAGLVLDGEIYRGAHGVHPEIGHMTIDATGPDCYCGSKGCWESLASGTAIAEWHQSRFLGSSPLAARQIFDLARAGDPNALQTLERFTFYLGVGLGNLITLFAPEAIALGGGVLDSQDLFLSDSLQQANRRSGLIPQNTVNIVPASFGSKAGLYGAAAAAQLHLHAGNSLTCQPA